MQPPKCFICEHKHWASEECPDVEVVEEVVSPSPKDTEAAEPQGAEIASVDSKAAKESGQVARNRRWRLKNRERYNAYMRDYMRRNR